MYFIALRSDSLCTCRLSRTLLFLRLATSCSARDPFQRRASHLQCMCVCVCGSSMNGSACEWGGEEIGGGEKMRYRHKIDTP